jgi:hypothetical protein
MIEIVFSIKAPRFTAGVVTRDNRVIAAAPNVRRLIGMTDQQVAEQCRANGWTLEHSAPVVSDD